MARDRGSSGRESADAAYRRGTVLGLTVAEVFIILLFLLMLVFLAVAQEWQVMFAVPPTNAAAELEKAKSMLDDVRKVRDQFKNRSPNPSEKVSERGEKSIPVPEDPVTLEEAQDSEPRTPEDLTDYRDDDLAEDIHDLLESAADALQQEKRKVREAEKRADAAEAARDEARKAARQADRNLEVFQTKGHNPPCWYERVPSDRGRDREKPYYTFEVAVFDQSMVLRQVPAPPGGAVDDQDSRYSNYAEEARILRLDRLPYNVPLRNQEVIAAILPIHDAGKNEEIRSYSCIFWARVWDLTSLDAKARWKDAHDRILEGLLGTYAVSDDPWRD